MKSPYKLWLATLALMCCTWSAVAFLVLRPVSNHSILFRVSKSNVKQMGGYRQAEATATTHAALTRQRRSVAAVQTQGLFGLGGLEIAVILIVVAFIIGPEKLGSMVGGIKTSLDDVPDELKKIPEEFQKGLEEGEINARARNAKKMDPPRKKEE